MNTTQLECFVSVANYLNFSRAAEELRITQPAVSHQIRTLEDELGVRLFHRTSKSVRLTPEGFLFTQYAGEILKLAELSRVRLKEAREALPARLAVGCRSVAELRQVRSALAALRTEVPGLLPQLRLVPFDSLENLLRDGDIDVMFSFQRPEDHRVACRELARCPVACVCAPDHPLASGGPLTPERLRQADSPAAVCRPPALPTPLFTLQTRLLGGRAPGQMLFCDNQESCLTLAAAGYAFALAADLPAGRSPGLCYLPIQGLDPLPYWAVTLADNRGSALRRFLDLLADALARPCGGES